MRAILLGVGLLAACGPSKQPPVAATGSAPPVAAAPDKAPSLAPGELRLRLSDDPASAVVIRADGTFDPPSKSLQIRLFHDGDRLRLGSDTSTFLTLEPDGTVTPENAGIRISADGVASFTPGSMFDGAGTLSFDATGALVGARSPEPLVVEGASTPALRRTAMFVYLAIQLSALGAAMSQTSGP